MTNAEKSINLEAKKFSVEKAMNIVNTTSAKIVIKEAKVIYEFLMEEKNE